MNVKKDSDELTLQLGLQLYQTRKLFECSSSIKGYRCTQDPKVGCYEKCEFVL